MPENIAVDVMYFKEPKIRHDEMNPLVPKIILQTFDRWVVDFLRPITPIGKHTGARYIITATNYLTRWA